jgi:hypothetical protein
MGRRVFAILGCALALAAPALAAPSKAPFWTALDGNVACGIAIHAPGKPASQMLCSARAVPAPKTKSFGDPGFVFLGSTGRPMLARLSQDTFTGSTPVALKNGASWSASPLHVACSLSAAAVRCTNQSRHGFTITRSSYHAF